MTYKGTHIIFIFMLLWLVTPFFYASVSGKEFVVVIDPGHGGHDPGAVGKFSQEKNINLNVALRVGNTIKNNCNDVKVIFTRKTDVFIPLDKRAQIANNAKADLFISIHTNALDKNKTAQGASTWTLGLAKSDANLDVAKRENGVILLESDYKQRYAGFNPNSAESYIMFEFLQDNYMERSVQLASLVQKQFKHHAQRIDRGVHQAGFLVLKNSAMPSILVELGFISTPNEERYLNTKEAEISLSNSIYRAFITYKNEQMHTNTSVEIIPSQSAALEEGTEAETREISLPIDTPSNREPKEVKTQQDNRINNNNEDFVFKIQILTSAKELNKTDKRFKGIKPVHYYKEKGMYKYTYGSSANYNEIVRLKKSLAQKFDDSFIIAFSDDEKVDVQKAIAAFKKKQR